MSIRTTSLILAACLAASPILARAEVVSLKGLEDKTKTVSLPHGVPITVAVNATDLLSGSEAEKKRLAQFIDVKAATFTYTADREAPKTTTQSTAGPWSFEIAPLKPLAKIRMEFRLDAAPNIDKIADEILRSPEFGTAIDAFLKTAAGKKAADAEFKQAFDTLWGEIERLIKGKIPGALLRSDAFGKAVTDYEAWQPLLTISTNRLELAKVDSTFEKYTIPQLIDTLTEEKIATFTGAKRAAANNVIGGLRNTQTLLAQYLQPAFVSQYEARVSVEPTQAQVDDLLRYAGIDVGIIHTPSREELRKALLVNVYFGGINDTPFAFKSGFWESVRQRLSIALGYDLGDISGNGNSDIRGNNAYFLGLGFRLNKYFRLEAGKTVYRSDSTGQLQSGWSWGASIDITGFEVLQGLVTK